MMKYCICMVSDFFYPNQGGVESHIYQLSKCLQQRGHKVIVITHVYGDKIGIHLIKGIKVYYLPFAVFYNNCILPTIYSTFAPFRQIFIRENVQIVHAHSAFSTMGQEALVHARCMGLHTVFTDHSLFGFADASSIITNKFLEFSLTCAQHVVCVSHTSKENTVLRASLHPDVVSVIPNAVESSLFTPDPSQKNPELINCIVMSRLVYRKGVDLLVAIIPQTCRKYSDVNFIIGGDGIKRILFEEMIEKNSLQDRVTLIGELQHEEVRDVLVRGDIFLNTSLTEAFCMAIVEAASCGLQVISTNVGGVPEVLPPDMIYLTEPSVTGLLKSIDEAIADCREGNFVCPYESHRRIKSMYTWSNVTQRTEKVYKKIVSSKMTKNSEILQVMCDRAPIAGKIYMLLLFVDVVLLWLLELIQPKKTLKDMQSRMEKLNESYSAMAGEMKHTNEELVLLVDKTKDNTDKLKSLNDSLIEKTEQLRAKRTEAEETAKSD